MEVFKGMAGEDTAAIKALLPRGIAQKVQSVRVAGACATLVIDAGGLNAAQRQTLEAEVESALKGREGIAEVRVAMTADRAPEPAKPAGPLILAVGSGKGGVGKSTLSANLAVALARAGFKVGLVDADIYGPSQPRLFANEGIKPKAVNDRMIPVPSKYGVGVLSMGHLVPAGQALAWRGPMASGALGQLIDADWGDTQVLVVDLPPGTGDVQLTMVQKHKPAGAVIVSTPQDLALIDATRAMHLFEQVGVPVVGMVENMSGYVCPHCGNVSDPFGCGGVEQAAAEGQMAFLGRVPLDLAIRKGSDAGEPPAAGDTPQGQAFAVIAARVAEWLRPQLAARG